MNMTLIASAAYDAYSQHKNDGKDRFGDFYYLHTLLALSVVCVLAVFSEIMLIKKLLLDASVLRIQHLCMIIHESNFFHNNCVVYGIHRISAPCERTV